MTILAEHLRQAALGNLLYNWFRANPNFNLSNSDIRAVVDATDDWIEANTAAFNNALPEPAKSTLTADQKEFLFLIIAQHRFNQT